MDKLNTILLGGIRKLALASCIVAAIVSPPHGANADTISVGAVTNLWPFSLPPDGSIPFCPSHLFSLSLCLAIGNVNGNTPTVSGTWLPSSTNSNFTTGTNWTSSPNPPNWRGGVATFGPSNTAAITIDNAGSYIDLDSFVFASDAPAYSFTIAPSTTLYLDSGIVDNSAHPPNFTVPTGAKLQVYGGLSGVGASTILVSGGSADIECATTPTTPVAATIVNNGGFVALGCGGTTGSATITTTNSSVATGTGTLVAQGAGSQVRFINGPGGITDFSDGGGVVGSIEGAGTFFVGNGALSVGNNNLDTTVTGTIADGGYYGGRGSLEKIGTGTLTLDGINTYTGSTTVTAGTLVIGDAAHDNASVAGYTAIGANGTLMGYGTIGGTLVNTGILQPAGPGHALTVRGNYGQSTGGKMIVEVNPVSAGLLAVGGTAALAGTLQVVYDPGTYSAKAYPILTAAAGVTGHYDTVSGTSPSATLPQSVAYAPNEVDLVLGAPAGGPINVAPPTNSTIFSSTPTVGASNSFAAFDSVFDHLNAALTGSPDDTLETALATTVPVMLAANDQSAQISDATHSLPSAMKRYGGWFRGIGAFDTARGQGSAPGYSGRSGGFLAGIDRKVTPELTLGIAGGYSHTDLSEADGTAGTIETPRLLGYGLYRVGGLALEATLGIAYDRIASVRPVAPLGSSAVEGHNGFEKNVALQAAYPLPQAGYTIVPRAGLQYTRLDENKFSESGASGFDLAAAGNTTQSFQPTIGASALTTFTTDSGATITPELKVMFAHELLSTSRNLVLTTATGSAVNAIGVSPAHNTLTLGPAITARLTGDLELIADYKLSLGLGKSVGNTIFAGMRQEF